MAAEVIPFWAPFNVSDLVFDVEIVEHERERERNSEKYTLNTEPLS